MWLVLLLREDNYQLMVSLTIEFTITPDSVTIGVLINDPF